jgi:hypothetical protein
MKLNLELLRHIMLTAEKQPAGQLLYFTALKSPLCEDIHVIAEHVQQLDCAGLVDAKVNMHAPPTLPSGAIRGILPKGYEFIAAMRDDTTWKKVVDYVKKHAAGWTIGLIVACAKAEFERRTAAPGNP